MVFIPADVVVIVCSKKDILSFFLYIRELCRDTRVTVVEVGRFNRLIVYLGIVLDNLLDNIRF